VHRTIALPTGGTGKTASSRETQTDIQAPLLGIMSFEEEGLSAEASTLIRQREEMRKKGQWKEADEIRRKLSAMGVVVQDTPEGTLWRNK
jgi:cysteinyl-tRNA synthetase